jgi:6-methylsalicylate decarboxylase
MRIDVHAHMWSNEYLDLMQRFGKTDTDAQRKLGAGNTDAEIQARFALMDAAGVQMQIISAPPQSPFFEDQASAVAAARLVNEPTGNWSAAGRSASGRSHRSHCRTSTQR